ncbi:MAG: OmpA family protein [Bacteroidetes bacterium]|nr:OmpA family protein [Bacteroidota bacterium]
MRKGIVFLSLVPFFAFSQSRKEFLQTADEAFRNQDYSTAAFYYLKALESSADGDIVSYPYEVNQVMLPVKKSAETSSLDTSKNFKPVVTHEEKNTAYGIADQRIVHNLAVSYRKNHDYINAENWSEKALQNDPKIYPDEHYWYANNLMLNGKYEKASEEFEKYFQVNTDKNSPLYKSAQKKSMSCDYFAGTSVSVNSLSILRELDTAINGGTASFSPAFFKTKDSLAFASSRKQSFAGEGQNPIYLSDIFFASKKDSFNFSGAKNFGMPVNTTDHEAAGVFSREGDKFFFTRWTSVNAEKKECAVYLSRFMNKQWLRPMKLNSNVNVEGYKSMSPSLNEQGNILFFSSDRPGGKGKMDIWYAPVDEFGKAGTAVNLGAPVNTEGDEITPFYDYATRTLYFSSDEHQGLGGQDIFKSALNDEQGDTTWSKPLNLKSPINSSRDDAYFIAYPDQSIGYFASDRKPCEECGSGACYKIYSVNPVPFIITLKGTVYEKKTKKPVVNSLVTLKDASEKSESIFIITDDSGKYSTMIPEEMLYNTKAQKNKYFSDKADVSTIGIKKTTLLTQDFYLEKIPSGDIVIPGIEYDFDKATLRPRSKLILDTLADMLKLNDNLVVELSSHTDSRGNDDYNFRLSDERAKSCVNYLITKGIAKDRLQPKGYGETKLIVNDEEINAMPTEEEKEAGHQKNRRTAFRIIEEKAIVPK